MNKFGKIAAHFAAFLLLTGPATAQESAAQNPVTLAGDVMAVKTVTDETGTERTELVEPTKIVPGDRLIFGTDYSNNGTEEVTDFVVTNPLPSAVRLAPDADPDLVVSVDGAQSWGTLAQLKVTDETGATRTATHADVTHVRWTLPSIAPGESGRLEYPAIIR
ncbi:MAG: hypothetical protein QNJ15_10315 [Erythrobacter sp.]|nr:hypothetical protein [Erythrobacter sp.]